MEADSSRTITPADLAPFSSLRPMVESLDEGPSLVIAPSFGATRVLDNHSVVSLQGIPTSEATCLVPSSAMEVSGVMVSSSPL